MTVTTIENTKFNIALVYLNPNFCEAYWAEYGPDVNKICVKENYVGGLYNVSLNDTFRIFNEPSHTQNHRSLSVGDIIFVPDTGYFMVTVIGFKQIN